MAEINNELRRLNEAYSLFEEKGLNSLLYEFGDFILFENPKMWNYKTKPDFIKEFKKGLLKRIQQLTPESPKQKKLF